MSSPRLILSRSPRPDRAGFALLITITLLAFLVLLLVSLASLTRVETQVAANTRQLSQARQNALLALNVALGRLQELAGPDQRITATADIVADRDAATRHWAGVWHADSTHADYGKNIGWLVSGKIVAGVAAVGEAPAATDNEEPIMLVGDHTVGAGDPEDRVSVLSESIKSGEVPGVAGEQTIGRFAWWVGDEGVKAKATLIDPWKDKTGAEGRYSFVNMQRNGLKLVRDADDARLDGAYPADDVALLKVRALAQLPLVAASGDAERIRQMTRSRYHDITTWSASVPADVVRGGLKKDLTNWLHFGALPGAVEQDAAPIVTTSENTDEGMPAWGLVRSYAGARQSESALPPSEQTTSEPGLAPVVTYLRFGLNISAQADAPMKIHLFPEVVLWNPHNVPLAHVDPATGEPVVYQVAWRISNNRTLTFRPVAAPTDPAKTATLALANFYVFDLELTEPLAPGRSLVFRVKEAAGSGDDVPYVDGGGTVLVNKPDDGTAAVIDGPTLSAADLAGGIEWRVNNTDADTMRLVLRRKTSTAPQGDGVTAGEYQAVRGIGFSGFNAGLLSGAYIDSKAYLEADVFGPRFVFTMYSRMAGSASGGSFRWIANQNYLARFSPRPSADGSFHSIYFGNNTTSPQIVTPLSFADESGREGVRASAGTSVIGTTANDLVLRDVLPQGAVLTSLAQLQHANLSLVSQYPFYAVGNSLASPYIALGATEATVASAAPYTRFHDISWLLNRDLWDHYWFSTVPAALADDDLVAPDFHLPNARHIPVSGASAALLRGAAAFDTSAARLMLDGGFNVNSTSRQAWRALLAGHRDLEVQGGVRHPFSRFITPSGTPNAPLEGHRILTDDQIETLADKIAEEVLNRGPFLSLADFVNRRLVVRGKDTTDAQLLKGALQAAIDNADTAGSDPVNSDTIFSSSLAGTKPAGTSYEQPQFQGGLSKQIPVASRLAFAPGYLTQADLLTAIGPALTARSDTFVIRAYGDVRNPATGLVEGKSWCEAVVQRSSRYAGGSVDPWATPASGSADERFGRRFDIVSFRWLSQSDL